MSNGNIQVSGCTTGFAVRHSSGKEGVLTAAHCNGTIEYNRDELTTEDSAYYGSYDVKWVSRDDLDVSNKIRTGVNWLGWENDSQLITNSLAWTYQFPGLFVCKFGITTKSTCGYIESTTSSISFSIPNVLNTFVKVSSPDGDNLSEKGDSGAPWYSGPIAYGIHHAGLDNDAWYMPISFIDVLDVTLITD